MERDFIQKPWGSVRILGSWSDRITVRLLTINPKSRFSLQKHRKRAEEWLCVSGRAKVQVGRRTFSLKVGEKAVVPRGGLHRAGSESGAVILEIAYGKFEEDDIVRLEDDYGRVGTTA